MIVVVPAAPPRTGLVFPELAADSRFTAHEAARLYAAALRDTLAVADAAGGGLLVNYLPDEAASPALPDSDTVETGSDAADPDSDDRDRNDTGTDDPDADRTTVGDLPSDAEAAVRAVASEAVADVRDVRFERQVGSSVSARIGNTVTHLLREEGADSVAVVRPLGALVRRSVIDGAAMKLRSNEVVLGPTTAGGVHLAGFAEPIDFAGAFGPEELEVVTDRGRDADFDVEFLRHVPRVDTPAGLRSAVATIRARVAAGRVVPADTARLVDEFGLVVRDGDLRRD